MGEPLKCNVLRLSSDRKVVVTLLKLSPHEEMFVRSFIVAHKRARYLSLLDSERGRKKILEGFHHCRDLDSRFAQRIPKNEQSRQSIEALLKGHGALHTCYVMSEDTSLDGRVMDLSAALLEIVGMDAGALVSCIPGRLAYFEMEGLSKRYLLIRY